jgi:hypothetical protein
MYECSLVLALLLIEFTKAEVPAKKPVCLFRLFCAGLLCAFFFVGFCVCVCVCLAHLKSYLRPEGLFETELANMSSFRPIPDIVVFAEPLRFVLVLHKRWVHLHTRRSPHPAEDSTYAVA